MGLRLPMLALCAGVALASTAGGAAAQAEDKAAAEAAFQQAKLLRDAGRMPEACAQFEKSQQLDPQRGTQYNLALCYEQIGRLASAWGELVEVAGKDRNGKRRDDAIRRSAALAPRLTHVLITVPATLDGLTVRRDGVDITRLVGVDTPVDPGVYTVEVSAEGYQPWQTRVDLTAEGATITIEVPRLVARPAPAPPPPSSQAATPAAPLVVPPGPRRGRGRAIAGLSIAGAGVVATGVGAVFGATYLSRRDDAREACNGTVAPCGGDVAAARAATDDAKRAGRRANILLGAGAVAIGAGLVVWLTAPDGRERGTSIVPTADADGAGVSVVGSF